MPYLQPIQTLLGMYQFDPSIMSDYILPDGMDRGIMTATILDYCGNNQVRYGDPETLHTMINLFFRKNQKLYSELWATLNYDYEPLVNYDLTIQEERTHGGGDTTKRNATAGSTSNTQGHNEHRVSAFNSDVYSADNQDDSTGSMTSEGTAEETEEFTTDRNEKVVRHETGDNSARSTQYMIQEQRAVVDFNLYDRIRTDFEDEITIPVYSREVTCYERNTMWFSGVSEC